MTDQSPTVKKICVIDIHGTSGKRGEQRDTTLHLRGNDLDYLRLIDGLWRAVDNPDMWSEESDEYQAVHALLSALCRVTNLVGGPK